MTSFFLSLLIKGWSLIFSIFLAIASPLPSFGEAIKPTDADSLLLNFTVLADTHIETIEMFRFEYLRNAVADVNRASVKSNALVLVGDNTMNGQFLENLMLYGILSHYAAPENVLVAMGNHDINPSVNTLEKAVNRHNAFYNALTGSKNDKPYYYREIGGYFFIVLGSENTRDDTEAYISPAQIQWLDETLARASKSGKPIFLFNHQPFSDKVHTPEGDGEYWWNLDGMGESSDDVFDVVKQYDNVIFFYGHIHAPLFLLNVCETEGVTLVNVPPFTAHVGGNGFYAELYADRVILRARAFAFGEWDAECVYTIDLT
ncbi:MAG: metallophosphoesterase [Oscillospiraceae bacterium]|nr:metallophosphoesterase [Oscillospiraceae bacterium]